MNAPVKLPTAARAIADVTDGLILATIDIAVAPERVFRAISSDEVSRWWGAPGVYQTTKWTGELRKGGAWRADGIGEHGPFHVGGTVLEVDPPHVLSQTWEPSWTPGVATRVIWRIAAIEGGSRLTIRHDGFTDAASCADHATGWERVLTWLGRNFG